MDKGKVVKCTDCIYYRRLGVFGKACHYQIDTNRLRLMPASECYKKKGTPYKPKGG